MLGEGRSRNPSGPYHQLREKMKILSFLTFGFMLVMFCVAFKSGTDRELFYWGILTIMSTLFFLHRDK